VAITTGVWYARPCIQMQADLCCLYGVCAFGFSPDLSRNEPHSANSLVTTYSRSPSQSIFIPFWNPEVHYRIYSSSSMILILSLMNPLCVFVHYFSRFRNYSSILFGIFKEVSLFQALLVKCRTYFSIVHTTCHTHLIIIDWDL